MRLICEKLSRMAFQRHVMKCVERRSLGEIGETCGGKGYHSKKAGSISKAVQVPSGGN